MPFDMAKLAGALEKRSPALARRLAMGVLGIVSPFNSHLKTRMLEWTPLSARVELKMHRGVKNHVGSIHAGALFTLGESVAGLVIIKNFSFKKYRPIMRDVSVDFLKQARGDVYAVVKTTQSEIDRVKKDVDKEPQILPMETNIFDGASGLVAKVRTTWQVKAWSQVRGRAK